MASEDRILHLLKTHGSQRAAALGKSLGISASAVRQQLGELYDSGLVDHDDRAEGPGRPKRYWWLTDAGHAGFPDTHSQLTTELLRAVRVVFGNDGLDRLIGERERVSEALYRQELRGARSLAERVQRLARVRTEEGYMAESEPQDDGSVLLVENHCPICAAARECEGFCRSELEVFRRVLDARVERVDHVLAGARRCAYRISAAG